MARLVGAELIDPQGLYEFRRDDGSAYQAWGEQAAQLYEHVRGMPDERTAEIAVTPPSQPAAYDPMGAERGQIASAMGQPPQAPPSMMDAPPTGQAPAGQTPAPQPAGDMPVLPGPGGAPQQSQVQPHPGQQPGTITPEQFGEAISRPVYVPGQAAVDPHRLAREGVPVPTRVSETIEGGAPYSEEWAQTRAEADEARHRAARERMELEVMRNREEQAQIEQRLPILEEQATMERERHAEIRRRYEADRAKLSQLMEEATSDQIDPNRVFTSGQVGRVQASIAMALGAFGAAFTGGPNFAQQIIDGIIERDIDAQRAEVARKGTAAKNGLARLQLMYDGDLELAEEALRASQHAYADAQKSIWALQLGTAESQNAYQQWAAEDAIKVSEREQQYMDKAIAKHTRNVQSEVVQPRAATRGHYRAPTEEEVAKRAKAVETTIQAGREVTGLKPDERPTGDVAQDVRKYGEKMRDIAQAETQMRIYAEQMGATINPDGTVEAPEGDIPGLGRVVRHLPMDMLTERGRAVRQAADTALFRVVKATSGAQFSDEEFARHQGAFLGVDDKDAVNGLKWGLREIEQKKQLLRREYGQDVVGAYERQAQEVDVEQARKTRGQPGRQPVRPGDASWRGGAR